MCADLTHCEDAFGHLSPQRRLFVYFIFFGGPVLAYSFASQCCVHHHSRCICLSSRMLPISLVCVWCAANERRLSMIRPINKIVPLNVCVRHFSFVRVLVVSRQSPLLTTIVLVRLAFFLLHKYVHYHHCDSVPVHGFPTETAINFERNSSRCCRFVVFSASFISLASLLFKLPKKYMRAENMMWKRGGSTRSSTTEKQTKTKIIVIMKKAREREIERTAGASPHLRVCAGFLWFFAVDKT